MKFYPINTWNLTNNPVRILFGYDTEEEAKEAALKAQKEYRDQTFTGKVIKAKDSNEANKRMGL